MVKHNRVVAPAGPGAVAVERPHMRIIHRKQGRLLTIDARARPLPS
ncbi:MAG: hypothetical protein H0T73_19700 [Ardenticatenales bacterium]|nr:hypothetical protein [Ardenticatenales bacterium]